MISIINHIFPKCSLPVPDTTKSASKEALFVLALQKKYYPTLERLDRRRVKLVE